MYNRFQRVLLFAAGIGIFILVFAMPYLARTDSQSVAQENAAKSVALEQPNDPSAHYALAKAEVALEKWHAAKLELDAASELDPGHAFADPKEWASIQALVSNRIESDTGPASIRAFWVVAIILSLAVMVVAVKTGRVSERRRYMAYLENHLPELMAELRAVRLKLHDDHVLSYEDRYGRLDFLGHCHGQLAEDLYQVRHGQPDALMGPRMREIQAYLTETKVLLSGNAEQPSPADTEPAVRQPDSADAEESPGH